MPARHGKTACGIRHPFAVRKTTSGYNGSTSYLVVKNPGGHRVSVHSHIAPETAQSEADDLNVMDLAKSMWTEDGAPFDERMAEAARRFEAGTCGQGRDR